VDDLLTTKQLQDLLQVDRITIYRMLHDGRIHGFKVGGQWRFSRREIERWLQGQRTGGQPSTDPTAAGTLPSDQALPPSCIQAIQNICAEALGVAAIITDPEGSPMAEISNSGKFCDLILSTAEGRRRCAISWKQSQDAKVHFCHAGLLCASAAVIVKEHQVAIAACCQFTTQPPSADRSAWQVRLSRLATDLGLSEQALHAAAETVHVVPDDHPRRVSRLLQRVADTLAEIGRERLNLLSRLQHIAQMSRI